MRIKGIYAALAASDLAVAEAFYTKRFGRGPEDHPMDDLIQWRNVAGANIQIFKDDENAGSSLCTIVVPDMTEARASLHAIGLRLTGEREGAFGKIAKLADPDGNQITLAEPPS